MLGDKHRERTHANGVEVYTLDSIFDNKEINTDYIARHRRVKEGCVSYRATMVCIVRIKGSVPDTLCWLGP